MSHTMWEIFKWLLLVLKEVKRNISIKKQEQSRMYSLHERRNKIINAYSKY